MTSLDLLLLTPFNPSVGAASSLVLTLSGVIKDILLILGSVLFFGSAITPIQYLGYAIALTGLVLFKTMA